MILLARNNVMQWQPQVFLLFLAHRAQEEPQPQAIAQLTRSRDLDFIGLTVNYLPVGINVIFHTENGCFGFGPKPNTRDADSDMTGASNEPFTVKPGAAIMDLATS